jgi:hypothetical protein
MSNDSMVVKVFERDISGVEINRMYIFFDHNLSTFGIRGGHTIKGKTTSYSFYTDHIHGVNSMMNGVFAKYAKLSTCLVNFKDLPMDSNKITYNLLLENDLKYNEIVGFDNDNKIPKMSIDNTVILEVENYLRILLNVYNDY